MDSEQRLDYVIGQVTALKAFCISAIVSHPNPTELLTHFSRASEITTAKTLPTKASEAMIEGIESINRDLLRVLQQESTRKTDPSRGATAR